MTLCTTGCLWKQHLATGKRYSCRIDDWSTHLQSRPYQLWGDHEETLLKGTSEPWSTRRCFNHLGAGVGHWRRDTIKMALPNATVEWILKHYNISQNALSYKNRLRSSLSYFSFASFQFRIMHSRFPLSYHSLATCLTRLFTNLSCFICCLSQSLHVHLMPLSISPRPFVASVNLPTSILSTRTAYGNDQFLCLKSTMSKRQPIYLDQQVDVEMPRCLEQRRLLRNYRLNRSSIG